ncbi:fungal-specific transcription factor domain-containing protein [Rhexocercosporidium sp. MPI-PUGE-AT-0058]|nr:fungal-specific transcription factor domain-containing protein [Rhexocercosporidium sp. MPI-PUGE-AT-0058]
MPRATLLPDMSTPADVYAPYIALPDTPPSLGSHITSHTPDEMSQSLLTGIPTGIQIPINAPKTEDGSSSPPRKRRKGGKIFSGCSTCRQRKMKCDQRRPICSNCARSRLYVCRGYEDDSVPHNPTSSTSAPPKHKPHPCPDPTDICQPKPLINEQSDNPSNFAQEMNSFPPFVFQDEAGFNSFLPPHISHCQSHTSRVTYGTQVESQLPISDIPSFLDDVSFWDQLVDPTSITQQDSQQIRELIQLAPLSRVPSPIPSLYQYQLSPSLPNLTNLPTSFSELVHHYRTHVSQLMMPTASDSQNPWLQLYLPLALQEPRTEPKQVLLHAILSVSAFSRAGLATKEDEGRYVDQGVKHGEEAVRRLRGVVDGRGVEDAVDKQALLAAALTISTIDVFSGANKGKGYTYLRMAKEVIHLTGGISWWLSEAPPTMTIFQIFRCYNIIASTTSWPSPQEQIQDQKQDWNKKQDQDEDRERESKNTDLSTSPDWKSSSSSPPSTESRFDPLDASTSLDLTHPNNDNALTTASPHYTLDISFGIAIKTLWCLNKTVSLSNIHSTFPPGKTWSTAHLSELSELQRELDFPIQNPEAFRASISNSISSPNSQSSGFNGVQPWQKGIPQIITDEIKENHVWAFHYSVMLFFRRALSHTLPPSSFSSSSSSSSPPQPQLQIPIPSQTLISHALTHLENIDTLTSSTPISTTLWPAFIAAAEALDTSLRHRALAWFVRARRHGIGNIAEAEKLVREVWRRVDRERYVVEEREGERGLSGGLGGVDWRCVMRECGVWVMLT